MNTNEISAHQRSASPLRNLEKAEPLEYGNFPNRPRYGSKLPATIPNVEHILSSYGISARYNVIKKKLEIRLPNDSGNTDNADNVAMTQITSLASLNGIISPQIPSYVEAIGEKHQFNPVADWIRSKAWDGKDRLPEIYQTLEVREDYPDGLKEILLYRWMLSAVAAAIKPRGFTARGVLTFQGPQGIGKTSWLKSLVPEDLRETVVKMDHHLDGNNKDSILGAVSHWLVEIGELDSSFKKDVARLKGFLTSGYDKVRRPYARTDSEYMRRTVFFATVNESNFLVDLTGNTRWWTIPVTKIDYSHQIDTQQLFAQLAVEFENGAQWWLTAEEEALLEQNNEVHLSVSAIREAIMGKVDVSDQDRSKAAYRSASDILELIDFSEPSQTVFKECNSVLRSLFGESKRVGGINKWRIPLLEIDAHL